MGIPMKNNPKIIALRRAAVESALTRGKPWILHLIKTGKDKLAKDMTEELVVKKVTDQLVNTVPIWILEAFNEM